MSEQMFGYKGKRKVSIPDPLFLYIEWEARANPENNERIRELIEDLDMEYFPNSKNSIKKSLTFLTFMQAEMLFKAIKSTFEYFQFEGIALASQLKGNKLTGRPTTDNQPIVSPFIIDQNYKNVVIPLVESSFRDERFQEYSYEQLARYFTGIEYNLFDQYGKSLGLSLAEIPQFPSADDIQKNGALPRIKHNEQPVQELSSSYSTEKAAQKSDYYAGYKEPVKRDKLTLGIGIAGGTLGAICLLICIVLALQVKQQKNSISYLNSELAAAQTIQKNEHEADVFGRFFLTYYYTGNKELLKPFLSDGDARYTQPESASILSTILKKVQLNEDGKTYTMSYVVTVKDSAEKISIKQISFDCVEKKSADYGWVVTAEPIAEDYGPDTSSNTSSSDQTAESNNESNNSSENKE